MSSHNANPYIPFASQILEIVSHTNREHTFRMAFTGKVKPGQFFFRQFRHCLHRDPVSKRLLRIPAHDSDPVCIFQEPYRL